MNILKLLFTSLQSRLNAGELNKRVYIAPTVPTSSDELAKHKLIVAFKYSGGYRINATHTHVGIELFCWAKNVADTFALAKEVQAAVVGMVGVDCVAKVEEIAFREHEEVLNKRRCWYLNYTIIINEYSMSKE